MNLTSPYGALPIGAAVVQAAQAAVMERFLLLSPRDSDAAILSASSAVASLPATTGALSAVNGYFAGVILAGHTNACRAFTADRCGCAAAGVGAALPLGGRCDFGAPTSPQANRHCARLVANADGHECASTAAA